MHIFQQNRMYHFDPFRCFAYFCYDTRHVHAKGRTCAATLGSGSPKNPISGSAVRWESAFPKRTSTRRSTRMTGMSTWLVVTGTWLLFSHIFGMSSSQLTHIFQRGWNHQPDIYVDSPKECRYCYQHMKFHRGWHPGRSIMEPTEAGLYVSEWIDMGYRCVPGSNR